MRVLLVSTQRGWGGGEAQALALARGLAAAGTDVAVAAPRGSGLFGRLVEAGVATEPLPCSGMHPWNALAVARMVRRFRPDILHANDAHAVTLGTLLRFLMPSVVRVASRHTAFPLRSGAKYRSFHRVLCVSPEAVERCREAGVPAESLRLVPCGVDVERFVERDREAARTRLGFAPSHSLILSVANLLPVKGHAELIRAMPTVLKGHPEARLLIAGEGPEREKLEALVAELGIASAVTLLGFRRDVPDLLAACDAFVLPSQSEGLPVSVLEAMAARRPVVVTPFASARYLAGEADPCVWIAARHRAEDLAAAILEALGGGDEVDRKVEHAHRRVVAEFSREALIRRVLEVYREATAGSRRAA
ncbi:MAG: glycosyltransferase [Planctomycetota bacterium]|nr:MAG: glycosyltransferase [Planctomycetota bacterium]